MELRHLRYFVAVAEEGSLTLAAERRLHTAQPSLSRQIRDLEVEVGVPLLIRRARGIELTAAGRVFLDHARLALLQVEAAGEAARRAAGAAKAPFALGFLTGHEVEWLPAILQVLRELQPDVETLIYSQSSPDLLAALMRGKVDVAVLRREDPAPGVTYRLLTREPLVAVMSADHPLAAQAAVSPQALARETFIGVSATAPALQRVIADYARRLGLDLVADFAADNLSMAISLVASTGGVALLPLYAQHLLPPSVVSRPISGDALTIDLVIGYLRANTSPLLKRFLSRVDGLAARPKPA